MDANNQRIRNPKKEKAIEVLIRWWGAGAVYFFIGWGTSLGSQSDPLDFIFILGLATGLLTIAVLDPLIYSMLDIERKNGELYNKKYFERTIMQNVMLRSGEIIRSMVIIIIIFFAYNFINIGLISLLSLPETSVPLPGEPITFGLLYILFYFLIRFILGLFNRKEQ